MRDDQRGYIVVETIGAFILFVFLVASILSLVNIVALQARVHYALTQSAQALSMYSYTVEAMGFTEHVVNSRVKQNALESEANETKANITGVINGIQSLSVDDVYDHGEAIVGRAQEWADDIASDPGNALSVVMNYALGHGGDALLEQVVRPLVGRYLTNGDMSGDEYLRSVGVIDGLRGLNFYDFPLFKIEATGEENSVFIDKNGEIKLVVRYDVDYTFGMLPLDFLDHKLSIVQIVKTKAWLGGYGEGYKE